MHRRHKLDAVGAQLHRIVHHGQAGLAHLPKVGHHDRGRELGHAGGRGLGEEEGGGCGDQRGGQGGRCGAAAGLLLHGAGLGAAGGVGVCGLGVGMGEVSCRHWAADRVIFDDGSWCHVHMFCVWACTGSERSRCAVRRRRGAC